MLDFISTLPNWAVVSVVCAVVGGVAAGIGALLERAGMKLGRFLPIIAVAFSISFIGNYATGWLRKATLTPARTSEMIKKSNPQLYGFIETSFPDDYAVLTARMTELIKSGGTTAEIGPQAAEAMAQIRRKYAPMVGLASDVDQAAVMNASISFYQALLATDPMLCNTVAIQGPTALLNRPGLEALKAMVEPQATSVLQAAANAMKAPTQRRVATDADWEQIGVEMADRGATEAHFDAIAAADPRSADLCPGLILMMQTMNAVDSEAIKTIRAEYLADVLAG